MSSRNKRLAYFTWGPKSWLNLRKTFYYEIAKNYIINLWITAKEEKAEEKVEEKKEEPKKEVSHKQDYRPF